MFFYEIILISIAVAMDAFAVSVCKGLAINKDLKYKAIIIALWFGIFQSLMPFIGFLLGKTFEQFITSIDHWISFILLLLIGINMIKESFESSSEENDNVKFKNMLLLAIATSIDALAIGIAYVCAYNSENALLTFLSMGIITFIISFIGVNIGNKVGSKFEKKAQILGGLILIILGIKILITHLL